jgi:hypothetical protein
VDAACGREGVWVPLRPHARIHARCSLVRCWALVRGQHGDTHPASTTRMRACPRSSQQSQAIELHSCPIAVVGGRPCGSLAFWDDAGTTRPLAFWDDAGTTRTSCRTTARREEGKEEIAEFSFYSDVSDRIGWEYARYCQSKSDCTGIFETVLFHLGTKLGTIKPSWSEKQGKVFPHYW